MDKKFPNVACTKSFKCTISKKFPDGTLVVQTFGTEMVATCETDEDEKRLFTMVHASTLRDIRQNTEVDPITKSLTNTVTKCLAKEKKVVESIKKKED